MSYATLSDDREEFGVDGLLRGTALLGFDIFGDDDDDDSLPSDELGGNLLLLDDSCKITNMSFEHYNSSITHLSRGATSITAWRSTTG